MKFSTSAAVAALSLFTSAYAQTWSDCDPTKKTDCPPNTALGVNNYTIDFTRSLMTSNVWNTTAGKIEYNNEGAQFIVNKKGDTPTVRTRFYIFWGTVEVIMKAATGQGIVSSVVMQSDNLDEVDWEWIGGNNTHTQSNYFGKGNTTSYDRAIWHPVSNPQEEWHNYTVDWTQEKLDWYIDGQIIRTLKFEQANGGLNFPQTPCDIRLGIWAGGDPGNTKGTIDWSGGLVDYKGGPYTMSVKSVRIRDASQGTQYVWGDQTGSYKSIQIKSEAKPIKLDGENGGNFIQSAAQRWRSLSTGAKIGIFSAVVAVLVIGIAVFAFCCVKQRRLGKHERLVEDAKFEQDRSELMAYRAEMSRQRSEKMAMGYSPVMGVAGATVMHQQQRPSMPNMQQNYAQSTVGSFGGGRGYQRY